MNKHDIFALLNIPNDFSINIDDIINDPDSFTRYVYLSRPAVPTFCPECGCIMHSKGIKVRTVNHPIYQDNTRLILKVSQRRWKCTGCSLSYNEEYPFLERYKRNSNLTPLLVLEAMKDLNRTAVSIAQQFNISDSEVHDLFSQYVDLKGCHFQNVSPLMRSTLTSLPVSCTPLSLWIFLLVKLLILSITDGQTPLRTILRESLGKKETM